MPGKLRHEIKQTRPFGGVQEEFVLALVRTADLLSAPLQELLRTENLSHSQYNILRILRGAGVEGLPCGEISDRMVRRDPDLTRLLDKLEARGLVSRARGVDDRRVVRAAITPQALTLLDALDGPLNTRIRETLAHVPARQLRAVIEVLEAVRKGLK